MKTILLFLLGLVVVAHGQQLTNSEGENIDTEAERVSWWTALDLLDITGDVSAANVGGVLTLTLTDPTPVTDPNEDILMFYDDSEGDLVGALSGNLTDHGAAFGSGDLLWVYDNASGFGYIDFDDLPGSSGGDSVSIDGVGVTDPDFVSSGDIDFVDTSNTITANLNADSVLVADIADGDWGDFAVSSNVAAIENVPKTATQPAYTEKHAASHTISAAECYGGIHYVTSAGIITLPAVADGMVVTIISNVAGAVSVDANASDLIILDGTALDDGDKITSGSTAGEVAVLSYYDATGWFAVTDGWTDGGP